jgi:hypothetical protein
MPQLDLVTFVDQTLYVYIFFVLNYAVFSVVALPRIYRGLVTKNLFMLGLVDERAAVLDTYNNGVAFFSVVESLFGFRGQSVAITNDSANKRASRH